jgi:hypothetical protein
MPKLRFPNIPENMPKLQKPPRHHNRRKKRPLPFPMQLPQPKNLANVLFHSIKSGSLHGLDSQLRGV